jgi:hypothetical protein
MATIEVLKAEMFHKTEYAELEIEFMKHSDAKDSRGLILLNEKLNKIIDQLRGEL